MAIHMVVEIKFKRGKDRSVPRPVTDAAREFTLSSQTSPDHGGSGSPTVTSSSWNTGRVPDFCVNRLRTPPWDISPGIPGYPASLGTWEIGLLRNRWVVSLEDLSGRA